MGQRREIIYHALPVAFFVFRFHSAGGHSPNHRMDIILAVPPIPFE
jgi:hypothetical protein